MSESKSDNKEIIEEAAVVSEKKSEKVIKAKKTTKAKKVEAVVADEVVVKKEEVVAAAKKEEVKKSPSTGTYMAIAAGVLLVVALTAVTFFQDEYKSAMASLTSFTMADETTQAADVAAIETETSFDSAQVSDQVAQINNQYQGFAMNQDRASAFDERRQQHRAAYDESKRMHDERMAEMYQLRTAAFERMDKNQANMRNKMEVLRTKTQQIQLEMQQKMQAAYNEFHSI